MCDIHSSTQITSLGTPHQFWPCSADKRSVYMIVSAKDYIARCRRKSSNFKQNTVCSPTCTCALEDGGDGILQWCASMWSHSQRTVTLSLQWPAWKNKVALLPVATFLERTRWSEPNSACFARQHWKVATLSYIGSDSQLLKSWFHTPLNILYIF